MKTWLVCLGIHLFLVLASVIISFIYHENDRKLLWALAFIPFLGPLSAILAYICYIPPKKEE